MRKIGSYAISATSTSANLTDFAFGALPDGTNGKVLRLWINAPAVSAASCCASVIQHDSSHNEIWRSDSAKDHSTIAESTSAAVTVSEIPYCAGDHFHLEWSARPSGESTGLGTNCVTEMKVLIEEG